jgi:hypothetical protein
LAINGQSYDATVQGKLQALQAGLAKEMVWVKLPDHYLS